MISVGGDVPPELDASMLSRVPAALLCRGKNDLLYEKSTYENDLRRLQEAGSDVRPIEFDGGHEWATDVLKAASQFLQERRP